jgi:hypothetical protein
MAGKRRKKVTEKDVAGLKYFDKLAPLLERLQEDACQRDKAGNRLLVTVHQHHGRLEASGGGDE